MNIEKRIVKYQRKPKQKQAITEDVTEDVIEIKPEEKPTKFKSIVNIIPSKWIEKYNLKPEITKQEYNELKDYMVRYNNANPAGKTKITNEMKEKFYPKIKNK
jgi:hypothetical protein